MRQGNTGWPPRSEGNSGVYPGRITQVYPVEVSWLVLLWRKHSRLSHGVRMGAQDGGVWVVMANLELYTRACWTYNLSPSPSLLSGFSNFTKALPPGQGGQEAWQGLLLSRMSSLGLNHMSSVKVKMFSPDGVLLLEPIKPIIKHSKHPHRTLTAAHKHDTPY